MRRFLNDERGYREELAKEETAIQDLEEKIRTGNCDENATYVLKQQVCRAPLACRCRHHAITFAHPAFFSCEA